MKLKVLKSKLPDPLTSLRHCGYGFLVGRLGNKDSFVKRIHGDLYPRFHLYVEEEGESWSLNLHLDQKAPVYRGAVAHGGDYEGQAVENEMARIQKLLNV